MSEPTQPTKYDMDGVMLLIAQAIAWTEGADAWRNPHVSYLICAADFVEALDGE